MIFFHFLLYIYQAFIGLIKCVFKYAHKIINIFEWGKYLLLSHSEECSIWIKKKQYVTIVSGNVSNMIFVLEKTDYWFFFIVSTNHIYYTEEKAKKLNWLLR